MTRPHDLAAEFRALLSKRDDAPVNILTRIEELTGGDLRASFEITIASGETFVVTVARRYPVR
jgi:hypothetical protein